ncbi:hypothetical protein [Alicyclobacillus kakegawensis]|uniref:hypothetical protein n=1 Tax=Alicyclobacillus kakegawensis TaxID=392012 RepID=UPI000831F335|nr:hypothetical protein [Alicyclobacillus kakegawensis]
MRATAVLRELLILELLMRRLQLHRRELYRRLNDMDIHVFEREDNELDVTIRYTEHGWQRESVFMRAMLDAEAAGRLRRAGIRDGD